MAREVEVKLALDPAMVTKFRRNPSLKQMAQGKAATSKLVSTYYDTEDARLRRAGLTLRVRQIGDRRLQTVKGEAAKNNPYDRFEAETEIAGDMPDLTVVQVEAVHQALGGAELKPVFVTEIERTIWQLEMEGARMECALDQGRISVPGAGDLTEPVCEVELELISGPPVRLFEVAKALNAHTPLRIDLTTKAKRGYILGTEIEPEATASDAPALKAKYTTRIAFAEILRSCLLQILANEKVARLGVDIEGVHKMRVGLRQMRAALTLFKDVLPALEREGMAVALKDFQRCLGEARDLDVFLEETLRPLSEHFPDEAGLALLIEAAQAERGKAYDALRAAMDQPSFTDLLLDLEIWIHGWRHDDEGAGSAPPSDVNDWLDRPVKDFAAKALNKRYRKVGKLGRHIKDLPMPELHALRIELKKLRYGVEFFASLYPASKSKRLLRRLKDLQNVLGDINDSVAHRQLLDRLHKAGSERAEGLILGWSAGRAAIERDELEDLWDDFVEIKPFW
ncbi:CYTH and CHAD domain-containing protein [Telmatospirillum sp. J64-1]|uniref:CYTH and CHAD domain-containing protein n=1 Tax=Telmatospirillum sp. J64-1 TaxID=2502183 RepID=UPI00115F1EB4|nr:CYTH and CHAD domain-containing protein [Telmatospirillum sp. J64-1]